MLCKLAVMKVEIKVIEIGMSREQGRDSNKTSAGIYFILCSSNLMKIYAQ